MDTVDVVLPPLATAAAIGTCVGALLDARHWPESGTGSLSHFPYVMLVMNSAGWLIYGIASGIMSVVISNVVGLTISLVLAGAFLRYCRNAAVLGTARVHFALVFFYVIALSLMTYMGLVSESALGVLGSCVSIMFFASPLATLQVVLASRSSESLPVPMVLMGVVCTALWSALGLRLWNMYMLVPNGIAFFLGCAQVALLVVFPAKKSILP
jgi:solute carrier family 50 protein (sugar transporter)